MSALVHINSIKRGCIYHSADFFNDSHRELDSSTIISPLTKQRLSREELAKESLRRNTTISDLKYVKEIIQKSISLCSLRYLVNEERRFRLSNNYVENRKNGVSELLV